MTGFVITGTDLLNAH